MASKMDILVVGAGYVGLATAVYLATKGFKVTIVEKNHATVDTLNKGKLHFHEPELARKLNRAVNAGNLRTVLPSKNIYQKAKLIFIAIDSVDMVDWKMRLSVFEHIANLIGETKHRTPPTVVLKSTNIVGFADNFRRLLDKTEYGTGIRLVVNPEFLREGLAYEDTAKPWRIIIGSKRKQDATRLLNVYRQIYPKNIPIVQTDLKSAELIKLASNVYLAYRLAFIHEIADFARTEKLDLDSIKRGISMDNRIGTDYFTPGLGFGGSCLPKDCRLINSTESDSDFTFETALTALSINDRLLEHLVVDLKYRLGSLRGKKIAIFGAAFKPEIDDTRGSQAVKLTTHLRRARARVSIYEPFLKQTEKIIRDNIPLVNHPDDALKGASVLIIGSAHSQFRKLKPTYIATLMKKRLVLDYFGILNRKTWEKAGFEIV
ncbi:MAG: nucleotide sugar dehydrogenase [candidate division Zixibacteria bacterium]|nr:nucleotide sugar dehydrogenase [candidate division Zixibacteria bacterium]